MSETHQSNGRAASRLQPPPEPLANLTSARRFLRAPFPAEIVEFQARRLAPQSQWAVVFPTISVWDVEDRLDVCVGPENWSVSEPVVFDAGHVTRTLTVFGKTRGCIGEGDSRKTQASDAEKRCAIHFGVGRYLKHMTPWRLEIGDAADQLPTTRNNKPYVPARWYVRLRTTYESDTARFGPAVATVTAASTGGEEHSSEHPAARHNGADANPHGEQLRHAAQRHGITDAALANTILIQAGEEPRTPERAAAVLERLLARVPADAAARTLVAIAEHHTITNGANGVHAASTTLRAASESAMVTIDLDALGPPREHQEA
jgi:hypothetical protein